MTPEPTPDPEAAKPQPVQPVFYLNTAPAPQAAPPPTPPPAEKESRTSNWATLGVFASLLSLHLWLGILQGSTSALVEDVKVLKADVGTLKADMAGVKVQLAAVERRADERHAELKDALKEVLARLPAQAAPKGRP